MGYSRDLLVYRRWQAMSKRQKYLHGLRRMRVLIQTIRQNKDRRNA